MHEIIQSHTKIPVSLRYAGRLSYCENIHFVTQFAFLIIYRRTERESGFVIERGWISGRELKIFASRHYLRHYARIMEEPSMGPGGS